MVVKDIIDVDYINYQKPSMIIGFPTCDFKCDHECGKQVCQNCPLAIAPNIYINVGKVVVKYIKSSSKAICCQGLEPFDSWEDLQDLIYCLRTVGVNDDIVIYTGYYKDLNTSKPMPPNKHLHLIQLLVFYHHLCL